MGEFQLKAAPVKIYMNAVSRLSEKITCVRRMTCLDMRTDSIISLVCHPYFEE